MYIYIYIERERDWQCYYHAHCVAIGPPKVLEPRGADAAGAGEIARGPSPMESSSYCSYIQPPGGLPMLLYSASGRVTYFTRSGGRTDSLYFYI